MYISQSLKAKSISLFLLYMWQVEDLIRAHQHDLEKIKQHVIAAYQVGEEQEKALLQWYSDLIEMMRVEGVMESGHLQINKNIIILLNDLHQELLQSTKFPYYSAAYYKALPYIVELRAKKNTSASEIETCFEAMYGVYLLKLQKKEVSPETQKAIADIEVFLGTLSDYYEKNRVGELEL